MGKIFRKSIHRFESQQGAMERIVARERDSKVFAGYFLTSVLISYLFGRKVFESFNVVFFILSRTKKFCIFPTRSSSWVKLIADQKEIINI